MELKNFIKVDCGVVDIRASQKNGDFSINSCWYIMETEDRSPWAYRVFELIADALSYGKRWPDMASQHITDTRSQYSVTRDSYIYFYSCSVHLNRMIFVEIIKPPLRLYTPEVWAWRRALLHKPNLFKFWRWITPVRKKQADYVHEMQRLMDQAYEKVNYQYYNSNHG
jgi:hypothetical protein